MKFATISRGRQILVWLIWAIVCLAFMSRPEPPAVNEKPGVDQLALTDIVTHHPQTDPLFPWQPKHRLRKWAWRRYWALRRAHRGAVWGVRLARLALTGALSMALGFLPFELLDSPSFD